MNDQKLYDQDQTLHPSILQPTSTTTNTTITTTTSSSITSKTYNHNNPIQHLHQQQQTSEISSQQQPIKYECDKCDDTSFINIEQFRKHQLQQHSITIPSTDQQEQQQQQQQLEFLYNFYKLNEIDKQQSSGDLMKNYDFLAKYYQNNEKMNKSGTGGVTLGLGIGGGQQTVANMNYETLLQFYQMNESKKNLLQQQKSSTFDHIMMTPNLHNPKLLSNSGVGDVNGLIAGSSPTTSTTTSSSINDVINMNSDQQFHYKQQLQHQQSTIITTEKQNNKRLRTTILPEQLNFLYECYQTESNPSRKMLEEISKKVNLKKRVVQVNTTFS